ncbi:MAG: prepilin-type N-terminal cleavage/methylation domain-containing protein [Planctomycetota bacterium]|jgi:prepilin-type N-terminal cleavage/methylation domain-containing protein
MKEREAGMTLIEILVVITIIATIAGMATVLIHVGQEKRIQYACVNHVGQLVGLLESTPGRYPQHDGPNLVLYFVKKGEIAGKDGLEVLFCPGDLDESLAQAGGVEAYRDLDLSLKGEYGHLTSYAARAMTDRDCRVPRGTPIPTVLVADDSEDHHFEKGIVVGLTGGAAKYRDKVDDYEMDRETPLFVGEGSTVEELTCLRSE